MVVMVRHILLLLLLEAHLLASWKVLLVSYRPKREVWQNGMQLYSQKGSKPSINRDNNFKGKPKPTPRPRSKSSSYSQSSRPIAFPSPESDRGEDVAPKRPKNFAMQTILGQNIITCREFRMDTKKEFTFMGSFKNIEQIPIYPLPEIAFVGRSNVGKSSLLNCISGAHKNIAVESKVPGRTQSINLFKCSDKDGDICIFTDLPGYGYAKLSKEAQQDISLFVNRYLQERNALRLTVVIVDSRREQQESDTSMMRFLSEVGNPFGVIATKADKLKKAELEAVPRALRQAFDLPPGQPVLFSAETGWGQRDLWRMIRDALLGKGVFSDEYYDIIGDEEDEQPAESVKDGDESY
jgi:GTP-binding protein